MLTKFFYQKRYVPVLLIILLTVVVYSGSLRNGYVWDDDQYIYENPLLSKPDGLLHIWKNVVYPGHDPESCTPQYYPLVFTSFYLEHQLWGMNPGGYHLTNVLLHAASAVLLFFLLRRLGFAPVVSWMTAVLFALHPVQVESVAWATERKNVLSALFYFSAFICFLKYEDSQNLRHYLVSLLFFLLALLSKTVTATLPVALLLAACLRGRVRRKTLLRVIPFLLLGMAAGLMTSFLERHRVGALGPEWDLSALERIIIASRALWFYLGKIIFPRRLSFIYPRWEIESASAAAYLPLLGVVLAAVLAGKFNRRSGKVLGFGLLYFCLTLSPALGFVNFFPMKYSFVADHFQYLAGWGAILLLVSGARWLIEQFLHPRRRAAAGVVLAAVVISTCGYLSSQQVKKYRDEETLWRHTIVTNPEAWMAYNNLGVTLAARNQIEVAIDLYRKAIALNPNYARQYFNLGISYYTLSRNEEAMAAYEKAVKINPDYADAYNNLGAVYGDTGRQEEAIAAYKKVVEINPDFAQGYYNLGNAYADNGRKEEAIAAYKKALEIHPRDVMTYNNLATTYYDSGRTEEAVAAYRKALEIEPDNPVTYNNLGSTYYALGRTEEAIVTYKKGLEIDPDDAKAYYSLGLIYNAIGRNEEAAVAYRKALEIDPDNAELYNNLGLSYYRIGRNEDAITACMKALEINSDYPDAYYNLAVVYNGIGRTEEAIAAYRRAIEIRDEDAPAHNNLAVIYYHRKQYGLAIKHCDRAIELGYKVHPEFYQALAPYRR